MMKYLIFIVCLLASCSIDNPPNESLNIDNKIEREIDELILPLVETNNYSGALSISHKGKLVVSNAYGKMSREYDINNKTDTKFFLASASMMFTSAAFMTLIDEGKISLEDPLSKYLPDYKNGKDITIHDMLAQRSGIPAIGSGGNVDYDSMTKFTQTTKQLYSYFKDYELLFKPGEKYNHGRSEYILLALLIENISGKSFKEFLNEKIFSPLEMHNSGHYEGETSIISNLAKGYAPKGVFDLESAYQIDWSAKTGHASVYSTVEDLQKFGKAVLNREILSKASWEKVLTDWGRKVGYGWFISDHGTHKRYQMNGRSPGFSSYFAIYPDDDLIVVMLSNNYISLPGTMGKPLANIVLDEPYQKLNLVNKKIPKTNSDNLVGVYKFGDKFYRPNFELNVTIQDGNLFCDWGGFIPIDEGESAVRKFILRPYWSDIEFVKNEKGEVVKMLFDGFEGIKN